MRHWIPLLLTAALTAGAAGCGDDDGEEPGPTAELRLWHLAADAGPVDVYANGALLETGFDFEDVTQYLEVEAGTYDIAVAPAGSGVGDAVITVEGFAIGADERWTVAAVQLEEDATAAGAFDVIAIEEETTPPAATNVRFRVFHAAFAVPQAVDVYSLAAPTTPAIDGLAQGTVTASGLEVPNGAYSFGLDVDDDGEIDLETAAPIDMPPGGSSVLVGVISKPEDGEVETEVVYVVGEGVHDEVGLEPVDIAVPPPT